jgi:hypothetical protein
MSEELIKEPINECDHKGHWRLGGVIPVIANDNTVYCVLTTFCKYCGEMKAQIQSVGNVNKTVQQLLETKIEEAKEEGKEETKA